MIERLVDRFTDMACIEYTSTVASIDTTLDHLIETGYVRSDIKDLILEELKKRDDKDMEDFFK